jgi:hypothetical protein
MALCDIPPTTTIYSFNVSLLQIHTIRSPTAPPDVKPLVVQKRFTFHYGKTPEKHRVYPEATFPALWRGKEAHG